MSAFRGRTLERINDTPRAFPRAGLGSLLLESSPSNTCRVHDSPLRTAVSIEAQWKKLSSINL
jgi:hypothetical protein